MTEQISMLYYNMGLELLRTNKAEDALLILKKAVSLKDTNIEAWNLLGLCYYKLCRFEMARYCWSESLNVDSDDNKAVEYIKQFQLVYEEAKEVISQVCMLVSEKRFKEADKKFQNSILKKSFGECAKVKNYEGILKRLSGDRKKALTLWKSTLESEDRSDINAIRYLSDEIEQKSLFAKIFCRILKR